MKKNKKRKLDKVKLVKEISRDRIGNVPHTRKLENKKRLIKLSESDYHNSLEGYLRELEGY